MPPVCPLYPQQQTLVRGRPIAGQKRGAGTTDKTHPWTVALFPRSKITDNSSKTRTRTGVGLLSEVPDDPTLNRATLTGFL